MGGSGPYDADMREPAGVSLRGQPAIESCPDGVVGGGVNLASAETQLTLDLGDHVTMTLTRIPAGTFRMGSPMTERDRLSSEGPPRKVTISKPFGLGIHEVTQEQWTAVMGTTPWMGKDYAQTSVTGAASHICWNDAAAFCRRLSAKAGPTLRLPTEAEWEYACRAGSQARFSFGDDADYSHLGDYAWYAANAWDIGRPYAHPVGQKKANEFGLYDMHGNVWEWCADWWANSYANAGTTDPAGPASGAYRVLRGGAFYVYGPAGLCRSAARGLGRPDLGWSGSGFRVAVDWE